MRCTFVTKCSDLSRNINHHASFPQTPISLAQMIAFGRFPDPSTIFRSSLFLSDELPIRLARRIKSLEDDIPPSLASQAAIQRVKEWYTQSFIDMTSFERPTMSESVKKMLAASDNAAIPPASLNPASTAYASKALAKRTKPLPRLLITSASTSHASEVFQQFTKYNEDFANMLRVIKKRHDPTVLTIAEGLRNHRATLQNKSRIVEGESAQVQAFMDKFFINRIGIRLLINQHLELFDFVHSLDRNYNDDTNPTEQTVNVGEITLSTNISNIAYACADNARSIAATHYAMMEHECPEIIIECPENLQFPYIAGHIAHILFELMKNSLRAVIEHHGKDSENFPAITVHCYEGDEDITIKISDLGGGIPRSMIRKVFEYSYTTMPTALTPLDATAPGNEELAPLAGFGYGLPLSRLYALAFGGDLRLLSMEGLGTDAFLHLCKLSNTEELLV